MRRLVLLSLAAAFASCGERPDNPTPHAGWDAPPADFSPSGVRPPPLRSPGDRPDVTVYGYWPYWGDDLSTLPWDQLTHVAIFDVGLAADGSLTDTSRWTANAAQAMAEAAPYGVRVHLTLTSFSDPIQATVLPDPTLRARAIADLAAQVSAYGAHGVNVDIEGVDGWLRPHLTAFVTELAAAVPEVWVAIPAIDWTGAFDGAALAAAADGLFIMGYGYHWSGGDPGPIAMLHPSGTWGAWSLSDSVDDYVADGVPRDKLVLGLPLYGRDWPTVDTAVPGTATGSGSAVVYARAVVDGAALGRRWDADGTSAYAFPSGTRQLWYDDAESLGLKAQYTVDAGIQGVGFWALTYDDGDPTLWSTIDDVTHLEPDLVVGQVYPGIAGRPNRVAVSEATPGERVVIVAGLRTGTTAVPGCVGASVDLDGRVVLGGFRADAAGDGELVVDLPASLAGRTVYVQAVERDTCRVSAPAPTVIDPAPTP